ncbi:AbrB family transcriptional regulator [Paracoccus laeviglucosivorans]|nr:AbrB family transcriptional regulator [Paracoccus laeviglucosivorans]
MTQLAAWWPIFIVLLVFFLAVSAIGYLFFRRQGFDRPTAFLSASPGGLGEMALLGQQFSADVRKLVLVHSVRIVLVVTFVPFMLRQMLGLGQGAISGPPGHGAGGPLDWLALSACVVLGYVLGNRLRSYGGLMLVPMFLSAGLHGSGVTSAEIPYAIVAAMQVVIGCITGARFAGIRFNEVWRTLLIGLVWTLVLIAMSVALALILGKIVDIPAAALFLALAPGGFAEMSVIAYAAEVEVAFVVTCHAFRTIYIMLVSPILCRRLLR